MASEFPGGLFFTNPESGYDVVMKTPKSTATFKKYALVVQDVSGGADDGTVDEVGADPALILGIAMADAVDANSPYDGKVPVIVLNTTMPIGLAITGTLTTAEEGKVFGLVKSAAGNWKLELAETTNTRFYVKRAIVDRQIALGHFLAANLQGDAVAS